MKRLLLATSLVLVFSLPARADDSTLKPVTVPFELLKTKHIVVMVKVNGKGPYRVIFDTGAPMNLFNNKVAKEAELLKGQPKPLFSLFGASGQPVKVRTLELGDLKAEDISTVIMDHPTVGAIAQAFGPVEGIIGFPFFARYRMTLDYQAKVMTFVPNGFDPPDVLQAIMTMLYSMGSDKKPARQVLAPAAQWGMVVAKKDGDEEAGVTIAEVLPGSAAAAAGLKADDRLLVLDGRWTDTVADCFRAAGFVKPGTSVKLTVLRDGKEQELMVKPVAGI